MRYFKLLTLLSVVFFLVACDKKPTGKPAASPSSFEEKTKNPLEEQIGKITNTVLLEPLRALQDDSSFYREKQYLAGALDNSTQKDIFFSCEEFKKSLLQLLQTDYSEDFVSGSWQRGEVEKLSQNFAKEQCSKVYTLRANFLADLQAVLNNATTKNTFMEEAKPVVENYAKELLKTNDYYTDLFNKVLISYKKLRQTFYPLEKAGYGTYVLEQNAFKDLNQLVTPSLQGDNTDEEKINDLLTKAQEDEKILYVFLKEYESLTQTNGACINQFFPGLKEKWYDFMYEIEKLPSFERQAYADKRFKQADDGLKTKCIDLMKNTKKKNTAQVPQEQEQLQQENDQEENNSESEEVYDF